MEYAQYKELDEKLDRIIELLAYIAYPEMKPELPKEEPKHKTAI